MGFTGSTKMSPVHFPIGFYKNIYNNYDKPKIKPIPVNHVHETFDSVKKKRYTKGIYEMKYIIKYSNISFQRIKGFMIMIRWNPGWLGSSLT